MSLLDVSVGTVFWATIAFLIVMFVLKKFAWKPILDGLKAREESIENALNEARRAREEMSSLKASNEQLLREARDERDRILGEAREIKESIISEARNKAQQEAMRITRTAMEEIDVQRKAAISEMRQQMANLSLDIAEKVVRTELAKDGKQRELVNNLLNEVKFN